MKVTEKKDNSAKNGAISSETIPFSVRYPGRTIAAYGSTPLLRISLIGEQDYSFVGTVGRNLVPEYLHFHPSIRLFSEP